MQLFRKLDEFPDSLRGGSITIGNFDGVHRGHQEIINCLKQFADQLNGPTIVFTFEPHPVRLLRPEQTPPPLTWIDRKADLLSELGVDAVIAYPTDQELLELTSEQFFQQLIVEKIGAKAMVEGPNFFFGKGRKGNIETLRQLCQQESILLKIVEPLLTDNTYISSSRIRDLIRDGLVTEAAKLLTHPYRIRGMVTHGSARGAQIGFPTANLGAIDTLIPAQGVYCGRTYIAGRPHWSAINIGPNPTFGEKLLKVESHLLDFSGSIYGQPIEVDFVQRLRDIQKFDSLEQLRNQLTNDIEQTRHVAHQSNPPIH